VSSFYFAYGSNMDPQRVGARGMRFDAVCGAVLEGVQLRFDKQSRAHPHCGHANLAFARGDRVEGVLYRLRDADEIRAMDPFEAAPVNYSRDIVVVSAAGERHAAWTYFANAAVVCAGLAPERAYLNHLLAGRPFLSKPYFERLCSVRCIDD
jgi:cation transport regulator ChaC